MKPITLAPVAALGAALSAAAQPSSVIAPPQFAKVEAGSRGTIAGLDTRARQQILLDQRLLTSLRGRPLTSIWFRRDHALGKAYRAGTARLRVTLSERAGSVATPSRRFARNRGTSPVVVFAGNIALPASPRPSGAIPWDAAHTARIPITRPFTYHAGTLCIEIEGEPIAPPPRFFWSVDYVHEAEPGVVREIGNGCGTVAAMFRPTASAWSRHLVPGGTFSLRSIGRPRTPAIAMIGSRLQQPPLSLAPLGAPGCALRVRPEATLATSYPPDVSGYRFTSADLETTIPATSALLGGRFYAQWANLETGKRSNRLGITTTNALELVIAKTMPPGRIATVISDEVAARRAFPDRGRVEIGRGPVTRIGRR